MKKTLIAVVKNGFIAVASAAVALLILVLILERCTSGGRPERTIGQIDSTGRIRFVLSWHKQPAMLDQLIMRRKADGEPVCIVTADPKTGGTVDTWRYGEDLANYEVRGCDTLEPGVYLIEFQSRKYGQTYAYGRCEVCLDREGKLSFGGPSCNKGLCVSVH